MLIDQKVKKISKNRIKELEKFTRKLYIYRQKDRPQDEDGNGKGKEGFKMKSIQAEVAQTIRKELKEKFPDIKFSVRSESFAGGNSIDIYYTNGVPEDEVRKLVNKYESGHFDGMTDCYNYHSNRDYPTAKYITVNRKITDDIREKTKIDIAKRYGIKDIDNEQEWFNKFQAWSNTMVYRELVNKSL